MSKRQRQQRRDNFTRTLDLVVYDRHKAWQETWRNLHQPSPCTVAAQIVNLATDLAALRVVGAGNRIKAHLFVEGQVYALCGKEVPGDLEPAPEATVCGNCSRANERRQERIAAGVGA